MTQRNNNNNIRTDNTDTDYVQPSTSVYSHTRFYDARNPKTDAVRPFGQIDNVHARHSRGANDITQIDKKLSNKQFKVADFVWTTAQPTNSLSKIFTVPSDIPTLNKGNPILNFLRSHAYCSFKMRFVFKPVCNKFYKGMLRFFYDPFVTDTLSVDVRTSSGFPKAEIFANTSSNLEIVVPFNTIYSAFSNPIGKGTASVPPQLLGSLYAQVVNPLEVATGATVNQVLIRIFASLEDVVMSHPISFSDSVFSIVDNNPPEEEFIEIQALDTDVSSVISETIGAVGGAVNVVEDIVSGNFGKAISDGIGIVGDVSQGVGSIGSLISDLFGGLDRPEDPLFHSNQFNTESAYSVGTGPLKTYNLALIPSRSNHDMSVQEYGSVKDEMQMKSVTRIPMQFGTFNVSTSTKADSLLTAFPVSPIVCGSASGSGSRLFYPTYLANFSRLFQYWRGSLQYKFQVVKSDFTRFRLMFVWIPTCNWADFSGLSVEDASNFPNTVYEIAEGENTTYIFNVPFAHFAPYKLVQEDVQSVDPPFEDERNGRTLISYDLCAASSYSAQPWIGLGAQSCNGQVLVYLLGNYSTSTAAPVSSQVNLYVAAGDDYACGSIKATAFPNYQPDQAFIPAIAAPTVEIQGGDDTPVVDSSEPDPTSAVNRQDLTNDPPGGNKKQVSRFSPPKTSGYIHGPTIQLEEMNLRYLLKRRYPYFHQKFFTSDRLSNVFFVRIPVRPHSSNNPEYSNSPIDACSNMFRFWKGKMVFHFNFDTYMTYPVMCFVTHTPAAPITDVKNYATHFSEYVGNPVSANHFNSYSQMFNLAYDHQFSITVPWRSPYEYLSLRTGGEDSLHTNGYLDLYFMFEHDASTTDINKAVNMWVWKSFGDDFCFHTLVPPSPLTLDAIA